MISRGLRARERRGGCATLACLLVGLATTGCGGDAGAPAQTAADAGAQMDPNTGTAAGGGAGTGTLRLQRIGSFDSPLYVTQPPGSEDLYVVEQGGLVKILRDGEVLEDPFMDISGKVSDDGEQGLLSVAFDPAYQSTRLLYAYYTDSDGDQNVVELKADSPERADLSSERLLLKMDDFASNHNGGLLKFGPDGLLYIGTGDGGGIGDPERNAQDRGSLLGKILRIDPDPGSGRPYSIPDTNPFAGRSGARPEIFALGLRNPWRYSFGTDARGRDTLTIGDVGQNSMEEIDHRLLARAAGANFGWSAFEGTQPFNSDQSAPRAIAPSLTYGRDAGCSITGGVQVHDPELGDLAGRYIYGDLCEGDLRTVRFDGNRAVGDRSTGLTVPHLDTFGTDNAGHVYAVSIDGDLFRIVAG